MVTDETAAPGQPPAGAGELLARLQPRTWDSAAATAFEAAQEAINHVIGCYSSLIDAEERAADPNHAQIQAWRTERRACAEERRALRSYDRDGVTAARESYAARLAVLESELHGRR
ncbi:MAG: hypothetical protein AB7I38_11885 [Dehalococcoidia bacterium]